MLTPTEFEFKVAEILKTRGYRNVRHTGGAGDLAADLICLSPNGDRVIVQCKRYAPNHKVGSPDIQKFIGMVSFHHKASIGIFVTTSTYTKVALTLGIPHGFMLIDGSELVRWMKEADRISRIRARAQQASGSAISHQLSALRRIVMYLRVVWSDAKISSPLDEETSLWMESISRF